MRRADVLHRPAPHRDEIDVPAPTRRTLAQNVAAMLVSQLVTWVVATVVTVVQPRFLGPVGLGQLRVAYAIWTIVELVATLGTGMLGTIEVAKHPASASSIFRHVVRVRLVCLACVSPPVIGLLAMVRYDPTVVRLLVLVGVAAAFNLVTSACAAVMIGLQEMGRVATVTVVQKVGGSIAVITLLLLGGSVIDIAMLGIGLAAAGAFLATRLLARVVPTAASDSPALRGGAFVRAGLTFLVADLVLTVYQQVDTIVMSMLLGTKEVGWYAVGDQIFGTLLFIPVILTTALFPAVVAAHHEDPAGADRLLRRAFRSYLLFAVPIGVGTVVCAESFVHLLYGDDFDGSAQVLQIYGVVILLTFLTILLGRFSQATGRAGFWSALLVVAIVLSIPLDIVLVPWTDRRFGNGAMGGALSYIVTEGLMLAVGLWRVGRVVLERGTLGRLLRCLAAGATMLAASWPLRHTLFVIPGAVSVLVYSVVILLSGSLDHTERDQLARAVQRLRSLAGRRSRSVIAPAEGAP